MRGFKMATVLNRDDIVDKPGSLWSRADKEKDIERSEIAIKHFLKYCDTGKCIRDRRNVSTWHEGFCLDCAFNPYNMTK